MTEPVIDKIIETIEKGYFGFLNLSIKSGLKKLFDQPWIGKLNECLDNNPHCEIKL